MIIQMPGSPLGHAGQAMAQFASGEKDYRAQLLQKQRTEVSQQIAQARQDQRREEFEVEAALSAEKLQIERQEQKSREYGRVLERKEAELDARLEEQRDIKRGDVLARGEMLVERGYLDEVQIRELQALASEGAPPETIAGELRKFARKTGLARQEARQIELQDEFVNEILGDPSLQAGLQGHPRAQQAWDRLRSGEAEPGDILKTRSAMMGLDAELDAIYNEALTMGERAAELRMGRIGWLFEQQGGAAPQQGQSGGASQGQSGGATQSPSGGSTSGGRPPAGGSKAKIKPGSPLATEMGLSGPLEKGDDPLKNIGITLVENYGLPPDPKATTYEEKQEAMLRYALDIAQQHGVGEWENGQLAPPGGFAPSSSGWENGYYTEPSEPDAAALAESLRQTAETIGRAFVKKYGPDEAPPEARREFDEQMMAIQTSLEYLAKRGK